MLICLLGFAYAAVFLIPTCRELSRTCEKVTEQSASISLLTDRVELAQEELAKLANLPTQSQLQLPTSSQRLQLDASPSFVQSLGQILAIFELQSVECVAATPEQTAGPSLAHGADLHRVTLRGGFPEVLFALEAIERDVPTAMAAELSMARFNPDETCRWEIAFQFQKGQP